MNTKIASDISRLVWEKLSDMINKDESVYISIGCNGISDVVLNAVLEYNPKIDEDELDTLMSNSITNAIDDGTMENDLNSFYPHDEQSWGQGYLKGFEAGYRKAIEG